MPDKITPRRMTYFVNERDYEEENIRNMIKATGISYTEIPTSGHLTIFAYYSDGFCQSCYSPTSIKRYLRGLGDYQMPDKTLKQRLLQIFLNGNHDKEFDGMCQKLFDRKYNIHLTPTSGCTAIWIDDYEDTGYNYVKRWLEKAVRESEERR